MVDLTKKTYLFDPTKRHLDFCRGRFWFWFFPFFIWFLLLQRSARQKSVRASSRSRSRDNLAGKGFRDTRSRFSTFQIVQRHKKHILNLSSSSETPGTEVTHFQRQARGGLTNGTTICLSKAAMHKWDWSENLSWKWAWCWSWHPPRHRYSDKQPDLRSLRSSWPSLYKVWSLKPWSPM